MLKRGSGKLRVCHVTNGSECTPYFAALADLYSRDLFELTLVTLSEEGPLHRYWTRNGGRASAIGWHGRRDSLRTVWRLASNMREARYDIVQTHLFEASLVGSVAARLARTPLVIFTAHHTNDSVLQAQLRRKVAALNADRFAVSRCHQVIAPSRFAARTLVDAYGVAVERMAVIPYGLPRRTMRENSRSAVRREFDFGDEIVFGAIGRLHWVKNHAGLLEAFAAVSARDCGTRLLIIGDGPEADNIARATRRLGLGERVILTGHRADVPRLLDGIDVFVHSSHTESFNQALGEALLAEKPAVATDVGIAGELLLHGVTGYLATPGRTEDLIEGMMWAIKCRPTWREIGHRNALAASHLTYEAMVGSYEAHYLKWSETAQR